MPVLPVTDPVLIVAITMVIILVGPLLLERIRVPGMVGPIILGAVVGPSILGLLERDATFELLGAVGLLYVMFVAGVTLDLHEFARQRARSVGFGLLSFSIPMGLSLIAGRMLGYGLEGSLLIGGVVGTHTLLAFSLAARLGITGNRAIVAGAGATLVTDLLGLLVLAIVVAITEGGGGTTYWVNFGGLVALWAAGVLIILPRLGRWFLQRVSREADASFAFLMAAVFISAWVASVVGLAPIIGAFLAGIALNRLIPPTSALMSRVRFVGDALLIPFFLVSVGLLVDVRVLRSLEVWGLAAVLIGLVVVGKGAAALLAGSLYRFTWPERLALAGLTIPQAAGTLAVTLVGFDIGLFSAEFVNAVVALILVSCLIGPAVLRRWGRQVALAEANRPYVPDEAPHRVLIPISNPETAAELVELALMIRSPGSTEPIHPLAVAPAGFDDAAEVAQAERLLDSAVLHAAAADVPCAPLTRLDENVGEGIARAVRERRISTIVMGWSGNAGAGAVIFGTVLDHVLATTQAMVVVTRSVVPVATLRRTLLLVPPDAEYEQGFAAAAHAMKSLAARQGHALSVVAEADHADAVAHRLRQQDPEAAVVAQPIEAWGNLIGALEGHVKPGYLLALLSVREGAPAWRPALDRLPRLLARRYPENDLLVVYLPEAGG